MGVVNFPINTIQKLCGHSVLHGNSVSNGGEDGPKGSIAGDLFCKPGKFVVLSVASLLPIFGGLDWLHSQVFALFLTQRNSVFCARDGANSSAF